MAITISWMSALASNCYVGKEPGCRRMCDDLGQRSSAPATEGRSTVE